MGWRVVTTVGLVVGTLIGVVVLLVCLRRLPAIRRHMDAATHLLQGAGVTTKLKICLGNYMIISKLGTVYLIPLPPAVGTIAQFIGQLLQLGIDVELLSLDCFGFRGYDSKLVAFMCLFPALLAPAFMVLLVATARSGGDRADFGERAIAAAVRGLFLFYPVITTIAFEAFACYDFEEEGSWLIADLRMDCGGAKRASRPRTVDTLRCD